ncbi:MAG: Rpn family recombination-promoting nuclease/putative transposase [Spirochaetaceae bacterium]|nr:Rpn family recombination-promoting nuclease/putative transposase [Spirochaetaceae bacterium]
MTILTHKIEHHSICILHETFQYTCQETDHQLKLEDGSLRIFLNTATEELDNLDQKLQAFYHYLQEGTAESPLTQEISSKIRTLKNNSLARRHYMTLALKMADIRYEGFEEGLEQGREQGAYQNKLETAKTMLSLGLPLDQIQLCTSLPLDVVQELAQTK